MHRKRALTRLGRLLCTTLPALAFLTATEALAAEECTTLLRSKCTLCHQVTYVCPKMESGSGMVYWKWVMHTMIKEGATLSDQESGILVDCLSSHDTQAKAVCPKK